MSAGDRILKNTRQDKDLVINLNDGGTQASHFKIYGANPAIGIKDTGASYFLKLIATNTGISADKALTLDIGNVNRLLSLQGNLTVESPSILNQDLTTDANVEFAQTTLGNTGLIVGSSTPFSDAAGTLTLQNIDSLDATTEATIENAIDTLVNLTSIQGQTISLSGDLTVETASIINQDLSSDSATAQLGTLTLTTKLIVSEISKASADLKLITTTSGDAELNPADDVRIKGDTANNVSNIQALFGSDGNGTDSDNSAGLRTSSSGVVQYKNRAGNWINIAAGATANQALSNLSSVAINTSLISDIDNTDDLGSDTLEWKDVWTHQIKHNDAVTPDLIISTEGNNGKIIINPNGSGIFQLGASIVSDTTNTDDLGSSSKFWRKGYVGSQHIGTSSKSANYTILDNDALQTILMTTGSVTDKTITLPTVAANTGRIVTIVKVDSGTKKCIIDGEGAETINGQTAQYLLSQYARITIVSNGTSWDILEQNKPTYGITAGAKVHGSDYEEGKWYSFTPTIYKNDQVTNAGGNVIKCIYKLDKNSVTYHIEMNALTNANPFYYYHGTLPISPNTTGFIGAGFAYWAVPGVTSGAFFSLLLVNRFSICPSNYSNVWTNGGGDTFKAQIVYSI